MRSHDEMVQDCVDFMTEFLSGTRKVAATRELGFWTHTLKFFLEEGNPEDYVITDEIVADACKILGASITPKGMVKLEPVRHILKAKREAAAAQPLAQGL